MVPPLASAIWHGVKWRLTFRASAVFSHCFKTGLSRPRGRHMVAAREFPWGPIRIRAKVHGTQVMLAAGGTCLQVAQWPSVCPGAVVALRFLGFSVNTSFLMW